MRIAGITIPDNKHLEIGLTELFGVGRNRAQEICSAAGISPDTKPSDVTEQQDKKIREALENYTTEGDLRREISGNVKRLKDIGAYRGMRHSQGLPSRGQRTKTNSRTRRGNKRQTMGTGRRAAEKK